MMKDIFFHERGKQVLLSLCKGDKYISEIASEIGATYAHTFNLLKVMQKRRIVSANKKGRTKYVKLTPKGAELALALSQFLEVINAPASKYKRRGKPRTAAKKRAQMAVASTETTTNQRLRSYVKSINAQLTKFKSQQKSSKSGKNARLIGRYRFLVTRQRPRDKEGKDLKAEAMELVGKLSVLFESTK